MCGTSLFDHVKYLSDINCLVYLLPLSFFFFLDPNHFGTGLGGRRCVACTDFINQSHVHIFVRMHTIVLALDPGRPRSTQNFSTRPDQNFYPTRPDLTQKLVDPTRPDLKVDPVVDPKLRKQFESHISTKI